MKKISILAALLVVGSLSAQDSPSKMDARVMVFGEVMRPAKLSVDTGASTVADQPEFQMGLGLRFMGEIVNAPRWYYELGGRFESSSRFSTNGGTPHLDLTKLQINYSYWVLGGGYLVPMGGQWSFGSHIELRGERIEVSGRVNNVEIDGDSDTYVRPWARFSLDTSWGSGNAKPLFGFDAAVTPFKTNQGDNMTTGMSTMNKRTIRSLAPQWDVSVYLGLRF